MANGGTVPEFVPPESGLASDLLGSLSDYTLPSEAESTASDTQDSEIQNAGINFTSLTDETLERSGLGIGFRNTIPTEGLVLQGRPQSAESLQEGIEARKCGIRITT